MRHSDLSQLQQTLQYVFVNPALLAEALRHSSYVNEQPDPCLRDNERFEFLGDAVLNLVVGDLLMRSYPEFREGDLSRMRSTLVNESRLAKIAAEIGLGEHLLLGRGELQTHGRTKKSILADAFEAMLAAVYLDGGFSAAYQIISDRFAPLVESVVDPLSNRDYKSLLQEKTQEIPLDIPQYSLIESRGPDHDKTFRVRAAVGFFAAEAEGKTKKRAEQHAARKLIDILFLNKLTD